MCFMIELSNFEKDEHAWGTKMLSDRSSLLSDRSRSLYHVGTRFFDDGGVRIAVSQQMAQKAFQGTPTGKINITEWRKISVIKLVG